MQVWKVAARFGVHDEVAFPPGPMVVDDIALTMHVQAPDAFAGGESFPLELAFAVRRWWTDELEPYAEAKSRWRDSTALLDVTCWPILPVPGDPVVDSFAPIIGTFSIGPASDVPQCAYLVSLRTLEDSRRGRGRLYYPPGWGFDGDSTPSGIVPAEDRQHLAHITGKLGAHFREISDENAVLSVFSRADNIGRAVIGFRVPDRVRTQRRRAKAPVYYAFDNDGDPA